MPKITDKFDTKEERSALRAEHGWWALFVILIILVPLVFWNELSHLYGVQNVLKVISPIVGIAGIIFVIYTDDPKYDFVKWIVVLFCVLSTAMIMAQASNYRVDKIDNIHWDKNKTK